MKIYIKFFIGFLFFLCFFIFGFIGIILFNGKMEGIVIFFVSFALFYYHACFWFVCPIWHFLDKRKIKNKRYG